MKLKQRPAGGRIGSRSALAACLAALSTIIILHTSIAPNKAYADNEGGSPDIATDCAEQNKDLIKWCHFMAETKPRQINDINTKNRPDLAVSGPLLDNCDSSAENVIAASFSSSATSTTSTEKGFKNVYFNAGVSIVRGGTDVFGFDISGEGKTSTGDFVVRTVVPPNKKGILKFEPYMVEVGGWWEVWYKEKQHGHWWWWQAKTPNSAFLRIPRVLPGTNLPDGKFYAEIKSCGVSLAEGNGGIDSDSEIVPAEIISSPSQ